MPLAYAESPGLPVALWQGAIKALGFGDVSEAALTRFARSSAASFLVELTSDEGREAEFRLFHQALNDALVRARAKLVGKREDERALTRALLAAGQDTGWDHAPVYLLRSLPAHAARAGLVDALLADDAYLLYADLLRLLPVAGYATSGIGQQRARLLRLSSSDVITTDAPTRAAEFSVTENLEGLGMTYTRAGIWTPYRAAWASAPFSPEQSVFRGHDGPVRSACAFTLGGVTLIATTSNDRTTRIWNPATGTQHHVLHGHRRSVTDVCTITAADGTTLLATASEDGTVLIWNPATGAHLRTLHGHEGPILSVCVLVRSGCGPLLATASGDCTVRIWDPTTGTCQRTFHGHTDWVPLVCAFTHNGTPLLATASNDCTVRIWDPTTGTCQRTLHGHTDWVRSVCAFTHNGTPLLATASNDCTVRIWDPTTGTCQRTLHGHTDPVLAVRAFTQADGLLLLATAGGDRTVRIWDPTTGTCQRTLHGHKGPVNAICVFPQGTVTLLATAGLDHTARIWDPTIETQRKALHGHNGRVNTICVFTERGGLKLLATGGDDNSVRTWDATQEPSATSTVTTPVPATPSTTNAFSRCAHSPAAALPSLPSLMTIAVSTSGIPQWMSTDSSSKAT